MGGEAEATATEAVGAGGKRLYPMTTPMSETSVAQPTPEETTAGGGLKRPGDEALGVEGEGGSMFKMPRLDEMESSAQYQIPEAGEEDVSDDEGHVSGPRNGIASGRWSDEEHQRFLQGMEKYGRAWRIISKRMVKTRTAEQVRIHAQKYFYKQAKKAGKNKPTQDGHWTNEEHEVFLELYDKFGRSWKKIAETMKTRSNEQVRTHAQKYFSKLEELRDRGYQGRYNMDGKRHLTKSFLMNGPLSPDTPTAATMMMVNPAAVARLSTGAPTTGPGKSSGAATGKSSGKRGSRRGSDDEELDYDPSLESDKRRSSLTETRTMTYTSRSGRQVTTRKWDEELLGDEEEEDDDDEPGEEDHEAMLQLVRGNRGMPPSLFPPSAAAAMMVMPPGAAALMMGGPLGMPPVMPLVPPAAPTAPQPTGTAAQEDDDDDVIYTEDEEEDAAAQDDKAAETLLFWQQSQASGQESNDGSMPPNAAPPLPPNDTSMAQALAGSPEPHTNMLTSTAPVEMLAAHDDNPPPTSEYPGSLLMMQPSVPVEEAVPLEAPPQPEPPTVLVLAPAQAPVPDPTPEERARGVMVVQQPLPLPPPPIDVEQPDSSHATPADPAPQPSEGVQGMGSLDSPSSVHEMESAQALLSWQG